MNTRLGRQPDDTDDTEDAAVLSTLSGTFAGAGMATDLDQVVSRGRRIRTRHRTVAAGIGTSAAALVAAIGMLAPGGPAGGPAVAGSTPGSSAVTTQRSGVDIESAGFSVKSNPDHSVTVTLAQIVDPDAFRAAMAKAGIPTVVRTWEESADGKAQVGCLLPPNLPALKADGYLTFPRDAKPGTPNDQNKMFVVGPKPLPPGAVVFVSLTHRTGETGLPATILVGVLGADPGPCTTPVSVGITHP